MDKAIDYHKYLGPDFRREVDLELNIQPTVGLETTNPVEIDPKTERLKKLVDGLKPIIPDYDFDSLDISKISDDEISDLENTLNAPTLLKDKIAEVEKSLKVYQGIGQAVLSDPERRVNYIISQIRSALPNLTEDDINAVSQYFDSISKKLGIRLQQSLTSAFITDFTLKPLSDAVQKIIETILSEYGINLKQKDIDYAATTTKTVEIGKTNIPENFFEAERTELIPIEEEARTAGDPLIRWYRGIEAIFDQRNGKTAMTVTLELGKIYGELSVVTPTDLVKKLKSIIENVQVKIAELFKEQTKYQASASELEGMLSEPEAESKAILLISKDPETLERAKQALHKIINLSATPMIIQRLGKEIENTNEALSSFPTTLQNRLDKLKKEDTTEIAETISEMPLVEVEQSIEQLNADALLISSYFTNFDNPISKPVPENVNEALIRLCTNTDPKYVALQLLANSYRHTLSQLVPKKDPNQRQEVPLTTTTAAQAELETSTIEDANPELEELIKSNEIIAPVEINNEYEFDLEGFKLSAKREGTKYRVKTIRRDSGVSFSNIQTTLGKQLTLSPFLQSSKDGILMEPFDQILRTDKPMNFFFITIDDKPHLLKVRLQDSGKLTQLVQSNNDNKDALLPIIKNALNIPA